MNTVRFWSAAACRRFRFASHPLDTFNQKRQQAGALHNAGATALAFTLSALALFVGTSETRADDLERDLSQESSQAEFRRDQGPRRIFRDRITPQWFANNTRFWYRNDLRDGAKEFVLVDAEKGTREPAFNHAKLAAALSKAAGAEYKAGHLPFSSIAFIDDGKAVAFKVADSVWQCDLHSYECSKTDKSIEFPAADSFDGDRGFSRRRRPQRRSDSEDAARGTDSDRSPDGKWTALFKEHNIFLKSSDEGTSVPAHREIQLSTDGKDGLAYSRLSWAPDSKTLVAWRVEPAERKEVYLVQSSPPGGGRAKMTSRPYALPGDKFSTYELNVFDVERRKQTKVLADGQAVDRFEHEWLRPRLRWSKDGRHFSYQQTDRGHQRFRVIEVDSHTGKTRNIIDEKSDTFIWTAHTENLRMDYVNWLEVLADGHRDEIIYASESNGWRHLYLIDARAGKVANAITTGEWVVRGIENIDETNRQVWFRASGVFPDQDPYFLHFGRANFDGTGLVWLTSGNGSHSIQFSPDRKFVIDTYSRVDAAPVSGLRRVSDGKLVCKLEEADITLLKQDGWKPPEVFVAKGRDGKTDIWGIISRPHDFDPAKKYPIIEDIYAGPQGSFVPKTFSASSRYESLTSLGFIVVKIDGMGTANRSKAFHDVSYRNLKDAGFPDRILWMKAAAAKHPYMDLTRVGVYGNSAGGQNAAAAVLFHPEFYKAAVASCGCHDNRLDKASWNEQWMGYLPPEKLWASEPGNWFSQCSNIDNAHRLGGKLFLIVGEMDNNVPPESTLRFVDALIKANKDFELLVIPNGGHGMGGSYGQRRMQDFFVRHLLGRDPPNPNASASTASSE